MYNVVYISLRDTHMSH